MANVLFKRGTQAALADATYADGTFYLTTDTHRLYTGVDGQIVPVNEGVITVEDVASLPQSPFTGVNAGEFYYATAENILCVFNGKKFVQINSDTNTHKNTKIDTVTFVDAVDATNNTITITLTIQERTYNENGALVTTEDKITKSIALTQAELNSVLDLAVDTGATVTNGVATIKTSGNGSGGNGYSVKGSGSVTITSDGSDGYIISGTDTNTKNKSASVSVNAGNVTIGVTDTDGQIVSNTASNVLYYNIDGTKVYNQSDLWDTLKTKFDGINAMVYKGTIGTQGSTTGSAGTSLPTTGVAIGDTYKIIGLSGYDNGDVVIATGTETNGVITTGLTWTVIPSGDDVDTTYTISTASSTEDGIIQLAASTDSGAAPQQIKILDDNADIVITSDANGVKVAHKTYSTADVTAADGASKTLSHGGTFKVITGADLSNGHVAGLTTTTYTLPSDKDSTYTLPVTSSSGKAIVTLTGGGTASGSKDEVEFAAGTDLVIGVSNDDTIAYSHKAYTYTAPTGVTAAGTLAHGGKLKVVTGANVTNGHITGLTATEYTLPADNNTTYTLSGTTVAAATNGVKITDKLTAGGTGAGATSTSDLTVTSNTLTLTSATKGYNIDLVWGTF